MRLNHRAVLSAVLLAAPASSAAAQRPDRATLAARVDSIAQATMAAERVPGVSIAVIRGRDTVTLRGYGYADLENQVPATPQTVYRIGSLTKQFTALMILQLVREGRVGLDDTLQKYVPTFPTPGRRVTVRHLLNHTSGIPSYTSIGRAWRDKIRLPLAHDSLLALVKDRTPDFAPGERFLYDNTGYYLLGMIIENVTGHRYAEELESRITRPLGLGSTSYCDTQRIIPRRAQGYGTDAANVVVNADFLDMGQPFAAGALCSSVADVLAWQKALVAGTLLPGAYEQMSTPGRLNAGAATGYGFGLSVGALNDHRSISHSGGINGFSCVLMSFPDDTLLVLVLANSEDANATRLGTRIARAALGIVEPVVRDLPVSAADRALYAGTYRLSDAFDLRIFSRGDSLMSQATGQGSWRLLWQGDREFRAAFDTTVRLVFEVDASGRSVALTLYQGGVRRAPRIE